MVGTLPRSESFSRFAVQRVAPGRKFERSVILQSSLRYITMNNAWSQLFGRGVDFAESIFLLARLAESIFREFSALKF